MIKVAVVGAKGRMGSAVVKAVEADPELELSLALDVGDDLFEITPENTDIVVEFTIPSVSEENVKTLTLNGLDVVVGTTGWSDAKLDALRSHIPHGRSVLIAPNFSISAVLLEEFAAKAAPFFESVEIIELHHPNKLDAPSGTAAHTASAIANARRRAGQQAKSPDATSEDPSGARGALVDDVRVHAVRLQGLTAHEEVLFGNPGEQMIIRQDSFERSSFMPGVVLAVKKLAAGNHQGLTVGLGHLI